MANRSIHLNRVTLAAHLVLTGYGHWLPNDLRGSGSSEIRKDELKDLGDIHFGRKQDQPPSKDIKDFYAEAEPMLEHPVLWFDGPMRHLISEAFAKVIRNRGYTCWACAILRDHSHLLIRTHKDRADRMWELFARESARSLQSISTIGLNHPVWSSRPYKVLLFTRQEVLPRIPYIQGNPKKHGLPAQVFDFVTRCPWIK